MEKSLKQQIKKAESWTELLATLQSIENPEFSSREIELIYRNIERLRDDSDIKIAFLSNHTIDLLPNYLSTFAAINNLKLNNYIAPYNQYFQEFLADESGLLHFQADFIYLDLSIPYLSPDIHYHFLTLSSQQKEQELERITNSIIQLATLAKQKTNATLLIANFVQPSFSKASIADLQLGYGESEWYLRLNLKLIETFRTDNRIFLIDKNNVLSCIGKDASTNRKMYYIAKMELNETALTALSQEIVRYLIASKGLTKKCLVLDLDNTLWGGIVGEDGIDGLKIGKGYPEGEIFYDLQTYYRSLKQRGVILALASKNNPEDVEAAFQQKPDMPLKLEDFAIRKISWEPKVQSINEIAKTLNIGKDSIVFIDDNPVERKLVQGALPEVEVPELPNDALDYLETIKQKKYFDKLFFTEEDANKLEQYKQNAQREELKSDVGDINAYLSNLGTELTIETANIKQLPRIHQLFTKTNQFNVTTQRYDTAKVEEFINEKKWDILLISVKDNFGDMGAIGLVLIEKHSDSIHLDSFILSCRAMGRGIETAIMNTIKQRYIEHLDKLRITAKYLKTQKNTPVKNFFENQGFSVVNTTTDDDEINYSLSQADTQILDCPDMKIHIGEYNE